jgi:SAM-dependent methyltransferase
MHAWRWRPVAGDHDYERHGAGYARRRRADPRIAALVHDSLGHAATVVNVGAGAGSYEPTDRRVVAVEPSASMRAQRHAALGPSLDAVAESLPFATDAFDAAMAMVTIHQWPHPVRGLAELRRVARGPVVILTFDGDALDRLWLAEYVPELMDAERRRYVPLSVVAETLGGDVEVRPVPVPLDCTDGFTEAFYGRPERFLDPATRQAQSAWAFVEPAVAADAMSRLRHDLESGVWDERFGALRSQPSFVGAL